MTKPDAPLDPAAVGERLRDEYTPPPLTFGVDALHDGADFEGFVLGDVAGIRNLLRGGSVVDWHRAYFEDYTQVDRFLRVNEFDPTNAEDMQWLENLREQAIEYLERHLGFRIPDEVATGIPARDLLLVASQKGKRRASACVVLKIMHVLQHLNGRELLTRLPISSEQIFHLVEEKVLRTVEEMRAAGFSVVEFEWSRKQPNSLITKLLAKKESIAAHVYDKLRFRMITQTEEELLHVLRELIHRLVPFNYVTPGQSINDIIQLRNTIERAESLRGFLPELEKLSQAAADKKKVVQNEFSGVGYRVINFVADLPVRIDRYLEDQGILLDTDNRGAVVYLMTEFQIVDVRAAEDNESGDAAHHRYKDRQLSRVRARLMHGMKNEE
ncbi:MAG: TIGR04552 family protein [Deltaproteobacteria bacterium]|mgnify:CR=1 FL=1|nr:TIGR04552 family protein [Deltaproteobacteria bacterium]